MPPAGFEPAIPASEQPQAHALQRAATAKIVTTPQTVTRKMYLTLGTLFLTCRVPSKYVGTFRLQTALHYITLSSTQAFRCL